MKRNKKPNYTEDQIAQFNQDFSDDMPMAYANLCALVHFWRDEADRHWNRYRNDMGDVAVKLMGMSVDFLKMSSNGETPPQTEGRES